MALPIGLATAVQKRDVGVAFLIRFSFVSQTMLVWTGFGDLRTLNGNLWKGVGDIARIGDISGSLSGTAPAGQITASGVSPELFPKAIGDKADYRGRPVQILMQIFEDGQKSGNPYPLVLGLMTGIAISRRDDVRSLSLNYESPYVGRSNPKGGWYSDRNQQSRFPGDRFCERVPYLYFKQERWPDASLW